ncbi:unnamed protein product, partial [Brassica rapa]
MEVVKDQEVEGFIVVVLTEVVKEEELEVEVAPIM